MFVLGHLLRSQTLFIIDPVLKDHPAILFTQDRWSPIAGKLSLKRRPRGIKTGSTERYLCLIYSSILLSLNIDNGIEYNRDIAQGKLTN